jgi:L-alanine-DL-glutamate epimerase-like enolase superfamily enzyme
VGIRVDANGAWKSPDEALANLRTLEPVGLELCEEPVHGVDGLREVQAGTSIPIAMDETHAPGAGATRAVCLKITRGGITGVLTDARAARASGSDVYLASTFDGPRGIAAAVHVAAALRITRSCGLATGNLTAHDGVIDVPMTVGLA